MITKTTSLDNSYNSLFDEIREKSNGNISVESSKEGSKFILKYYKI